MGEGLAAQAAGVHMYGSGSGNTVTHSYGGTIDKPKEKKKVACKKKPKSK